jgi:hypothetical protein
MMHLHIQSIVISYNPSSLRITADYKSRRFSLYAITLYYRPFQLHFFKTHLNNQSSFQEAQWAVFPRYRLTEYPYLTYMGLKFFGVLISELFRVLKV